LALAHDLPPLSQGGRASFAVEVSADEVAFLIEVVVDRAVFDADARRNRVLRRPESLTLRERQVLDQLVRGATNKVIAKRLGVSPPDG
jgi:FixJ family two-component response regulator